MVNFRKVILGIVVLGVLFFADQGISQNIKFNPIKPVSQKVEQFSDEQQAILAVRKAKASVVNIMGYTTRVNSGGLPTSVDTTLGTGFVIDSEGLIVTNSHLASQTNIEILVVLADGTEYPATVLGLDKFNDVALLKIEARNLPAAQLGDADTLETGQTVFAIGNSLGKYQFSVTKGVVSGLGRLVDSPSANPSDPQPRLYNLIQTDAAINPGNSGGPLVDLEGRVIGITTIIDRNGEALGFAVPINVVKESVNQLKTLGKVSKPYFGVSFLTVNRAVQIQNGLPVANGALVTAVAPNSPAAQVGILPGDVIIKINDSKLNLVNELDAVLQRFKAGNQVFVTLLRNGEELYLPVILGDYSSR